MAETVALTLEQIAAQKEATHRDRQRQLEWAVVIQRRLDSGCAGDVTLVAREGDREHQVERVMTSYEDGSFLIDRSPAGMVVDQDCAKSCQIVLPIPCADGHTPGATALGLLSPSHSLAHFAAVSLI
jgi:hypothetical protein